MVSLTATPLREKTAFSSLADAADTLPEDAIQAARKTLSVAKRDAELAALLGQPSFLGNFKYGLVSGVANLLAANDQRVQAIYTYDPTLCADSEVGEEMPLDMALHLLVLVEAPTAALQAFIDSLDRALTESLKELPSPIFAERTFLLDVSLVTEKDIRLGL